MNPSEYYSLKAREKRSAVKLEKQKQIVFVCGMLMLIVGAVIIIVK